MMKVNDSIILQESIQSIHMFPEKDCEPDTSLVQVGSKGVVEELFPSGAGIGRFGDIRVLMFNMEQSVVVAKSN